VCFHWDPGTREGFILVVELTPKELNGNGAGDVRSAFRTANGNGNGHHNGNGERRRSELADFLRKRRAALQPEEVGLQNGGRRRTPGLRREEVAQLAGVGATWYTWLEQGRDVRASLDVLEALARGLRLTPAERIHLILLGRGEEAAPCPGPAERVSPTVKRLIQGLGANPAYLLGRRWDYLAWNDAAAAVFRDFGKLPREERNHAWQTFTDPQRREMMPDWEKSSRLVVAKFRADSAHHLGDPAFEQLIAALRNASPEFCKAWKRHEVARSGEGRKILNHPIAGRLVFEHSVFHPQESPEQRLILYSPTDECGTREKLAELLSA
jgi:transcriptional regulator with XRE-family HTH domain